MQLFRTDRPLTPAWNLVGPSIGLLRQHIWPVFYLGFLPLLAATLGAVLLTSRIDTAVRQPEIVFGSQEVAGLIIMLAGFLAAIITYPGLIYLQLQAIRKQHVSAVEAFKKGLPKVLPVFAMGFIEVILVGIGLLLFIIPGLILIRKFLLASYYVVDKDLGPVAALKQSAADSKPNAGPIWGVIGITILFGVLASFVSYLPLIGTILNIAIGFLYIFGPALRYGEIVHHLKVDSEAS